MWEWKRYEPLRPHGWSTETVSVPKGFNGTLRDVLGWWTNRWNGQLSHKIHRVASFFPCPCFSRFRGSNPGGPTKFLHGKNLEHWSNEGVEQWVGRQCGPKFHCSIFQVFRSPLLRAFLLELSKIGPGGGCHWGTPNNSSYSSKSTNVDLTPWTWTWTIIH